MKLKFKLWDVVQKQMYGVSCIRFGDDGSALTITVERAPKEKYFSLYVDGENGILRQFTGLRDKNGRDMYSQDLFEDDNGNIYRCYPVSGGFAMSIPAFPSTLKAEHPYPLESLSDEQNVSWFESNCIIC